MFNLIDVIAILVIAISTFIGYKRGLIKTVISLFSFAIAMAVALALYKQVAIILTEKTSIDDWVIERIENSSGDNEIEETVIGSKVYVNDIVTEEDDGSFLDELPNIIAQNIDLEEVKSNIKHEIAIKVSELAMKIISLIMIYLLIKVTLIVAGFLLDGVMKLPVLKQANEILGMIFGASLGFIELYIVFAIFTFISSITDISFIVDAIKGSMIASILFNNNFILKLLF